LKERSKKSRAKAVEPEKELNITPKPSLGGSEPFVNELSLKEEGLGESEALPNTDVSQEETAKSLDLKKTEMQEKKVAANAEFAIQLDQEISELEDEQIQTLDPDFLNKINLLDQELEDLFVEAKSDSEKLDIKYNELEETKNKFLLMLNGEKFRFSNFYHKLKGYLSEEVSNDFFGEEVESLVNKMSYDLKEFYVTMSKTSDLESTVDQGFSQLSQLVMHEKSDEIYNITRIQGESRGLSNQAISLNPDENSNKNLLEILESLEDYKKSAVMSAEKIGTAIVSKVDSQIEMIEKSLIGGEELLKNISEKKENRSKK
jgi:hypothetical protein